jgi:hypothetical protein
MAGIESKESSTGVRLLSAYKRGLVTLQTQPLIHPGLTIQSQACPEMVVEQAPLTAQPWIFRIRRNFKFKFSGSASIDTANPGQISCESAGMQLGFTANPGVLGGLYTVTIDPLTQYNAARLSNTSALAARMPISFDPWEIDCNDLLTVNPNAQWFQLIEFLNVNSVAGAPVAANIVWNFQVAIAQFTDYHFDKWE